MTVPQGAPEVPAGKLREWREDGAVYKKIAAMMAEWAAGKERGTVLPGNAFFARDLDVQAVPRTFYAARKLLVREGVLTRLHADGGPFMAALRVPVWPRSPGGITRAGAVPRLRPARGDDREIVCAAGRLNYPGKDE